MRRLFFALATIAFTTPAGVAAAAPSGALPAHAAPSGLHSIDGTDGGRLLVGALSKQSSTDAAFRAALRTIRGGYFDTTPNLVGVVRSTDQSLTIAAFTATLQRAPVNGMVYTIFDPSGGSRVGVFFDLGGRHERNLAGPVRGQYCCRDRQGRSGSLAHHVAQRVQIAPRHRPATYAASWAREEKPSF